MANKLLGMLLAAAAGATSLVPASGLATRGDCGQPGTDGSVPSMPDLEMPTGLSDLGGLANPQGTPLTEWNGIPVISSATAGEETSGFYSYKAAATIDEVSNFYKDEMQKLGWNEFFTMPDTGSGALLSYEKDNHVTTITISSVEDGVTLVFLTYQ